jgi:hypothetical protein
MKRLPTLLVSSIISALVCISVWGLFSAPRAARAQDDPFTRARTPHCTKGTVSGTYGYRMQGAIVGVGPFLVNGLFTHNPDGTSTVRAYVTINGQSFLTTGANGTFKVNSDCTGSGTFFGPELMQQISYDFVAVDGGEQMQILNTNSGIALQGYGRRIAKSGHATRCNDGMILGNYGYRLDGSLPGLPNVASIGLLTHSLDSNFGGRLKGFDAISLNGTQVPRRDYEGTFKVNSDCTGTAKYTDSLNNTVNYVFTVVDEGREIYLMGATSTGDNISGVAQRVR